MPVRTIPALPSDPLSEEQQLRKHIDRQQHYQRELEHIAEEAWHLYAAAIDFTIKLGPLPM